MVDATAMGATSPDGIAYLVSGSPINPVSESAQQASTVQAALNRRQLASYYWANQSERTGQTGMRQGDTGYQTDNDQPYWYTGTAFGWIPVLVGHQSYGGGRMISGSVDITPTATTTANEWVGRTVIAFPTGFFNSTPQIQVSVYSNYPLNVSASYTAATAAGFTVCLGRTGATGALATVSWSASQ